MGIVGTLIVVLTSVWVLIDAKIIGVKKGQVTGLLDLGPWGWFFCSLLLWIVAFPCYLIKRRGYKRINGRAGGAALATTIGFFFVAAEIGIIVMAFLGADMMSTAGTPPPAAVAKALPHAPAESEAQYVRSAKEIKSKDDATGIYYKEFLKNPDKFKAVRLSVVGKVQDIWETDGVTRLYMIISYKYTTPVAVRYPESIGVYRDDFIRVYGDGEGSTVQKSVAGTDLILPLISARFIKKCRSVRDCPK
jgi:hypothetical protein